MNEKLFNFVLKDVQPVEAFKRFRHGGLILLNRTEWRGKEPRSCGITKVQPRPITAGSSAPLFTDVVVTFRPKGFITFYRDTRYDGWTAMTPKKSVDGTLVDKDGRPLANGELPVFDPVEVFPDMEFNELDFGEFVGESVGQGVKKTTTEAAYKAFEASGRFVASVNSSFVAQRRERQSTKIILSNMPSGTPIDNFGTRIININNSTPQLERVLLENVERLMIDFLEGRASIKSISNDEMVLVQMSDAVVDCTPNEHGLDSWFDVWNMYVPSDYLEQLAKRIMSRYKVDVTVVQGTAPGLLLKTIKDEV